MPSSFRPGLLFHPRVHPKQIASFTFPADLDRRHAILLGFVEVWGDGRLDDTKEVSLHGDFLSRVFGDALGYRTITQSGVDGWDLEAERRMGAGGKSVDGALGFFRQGEPGRVLVPIELKSVRQDLDRAGNRALTPVQQAWDHANHSPGCRFIIVSNYKETRLYSTTRTPDVCETFLLEDLATMDGFKRFYYLLARERLLGPTPGVASPVDLLLAASAQAEEQVTRELYREYRNLRERLYTELRRVHSNLPALEVLGYAQTILDRVLFIAFAEDRDLLPKKSLVDAIEHRDKYAPRPSWENLKAVFRWIDQGNPELSFPAYNGGLFQPCAQIDHLEVSDELCKELGNLARYDFRDDISVEVLGHIFEQSISDLEALRHTAEGESGGQPAQPAVLTKRHDEGIYYTPTYITRYIVDRTLGRTLAERREAIFDRVKPEEKKAKKEQTSASIEAWEAYREELKGLRALDPACGSGVFLVAAYDALGREYERVNAELAELRGGQVTMFDLTKAVLNNNLFGVDLNAESVEITKLSLWLKTAQKGRRLMYLDSNVKWGDSIVKDPDLSRVAFDWARGKMARAFLDAPTDPDAASIDARWREGFDVVISNPPYIRHELFTHLKDHLSRSYIAYHGMADIYVYFFERGLSVLKPGGRLGFIVSNKWFRAGYAAPLRTLLCRRTEVESMIDFDHAPIFKDADTFPCVIALRKLADGAEVSIDHEFSVTAFPRSELEKIEIVEYVASHHYAVPQKRLSQEPWSLEPEAAQKLYRKIGEAGEPLVQFARVKPYRGLLTGLNDAFVVDDATRDHLVRLDPGSAAIIHKCLRGRDIGRWAANWGGLWIICAQHGIQIDAYPAIKHHLSSFRKTLEPRPKDITDSNWPGRKPGSYKWYELQDSVDYWDMFRLPKIVYQEIQFHPSYAFDRDGLLLNNKGFFVCSEDCWLLATLNSPLMWWHNWRYLGHMKDEALSPTGVKMEQLPIAPPSDEARRIAEAYVPQLVAFVKDNQETRAGVHDALKTQMNIEAPGQKLRALETLSRDNFVAEVTKRRPKGASKLKPSELKYLREIYDEYTVPIQDRHARALVMERRLSDLVNQAYGLGPDEVELLWATAPPRMPVGR